MREEVYHNTKYSKTIKFKNGSIVITQEEYSNKGKEFAYGDYYKLYCLIKDSIQMGKVLNKPNGHNKGYFLETLRLRVAFYDNETRTLTIDSKYDSLMDSFYTRTLSNVERNLLILEIFNFFMNC